MRKWQLVIFFCVIHTIFNPSESTLNEHTCKSRKTGDHKRLYFLHNLSKNRNKVDPSSWGCLPSPLWNNLTKNWKQGSQNVHVGRKRVNFIYVL